MAIRRVLLELEARLEPVTQTVSRDAPSGKLEFKRYGDGRQRMRIRCKGLKLADGAGLALLSGKTVVAVLETKKGQAKIDEERMASADTPPLAEGDIVTLRHDGVPLLKGQVYRD